MDLNRFRTRTNALITLAALLYAFGVVQLLHPLLHQHGHRNCLGQQCRQHPRGIERPFPLEENHCIVCALKGHLKAVASLFAPETYAGFHAAGPPPALESLVAAGGYERLPKPRAPPA